MAWIKSHLKKISIGTALAVTFAVGYLVHQHHAMSAPEARPNEYLYLDADELTRTWDSFRTDYRAT